MLQHDFAPHDSVCLFFGQNDTHAPTIICRKTGETKLNPHPAAGQPYGAIDFQAILKSIADPASKPKEEAPAIIPSRFISPWARNHATQKEAGRFIWSCFDIDKGDPSLENVRRVFEEVFPDAAKLIYSTSSATADDKRWRVLMPMVEVGGKDFVKIQRAAFELIEEKGLILDKALDRCGQPVYLPNVPPAKRDKDGKPLFYEYDIIRAKKLDALAHAGIQDRINRADLRENAMREEAEAQRLRAQQKRIERTAQFGPSQSPIDHFNEAHPLEELLLQYGYQHLGGPHYASPNSQSKGSAVRIWDGERWSSLTSGDADIGQPGSVGTWGDAFDLFVHYEHGGDRTAALKAYARSAGLPNGSQADDDSDFDFVDPGEAQAGDQTQEKKSRLEWFDEIEIASTSPYIVKGVLDAGAMSVVYGPSNSGKTFFALDLAYHIALGAPWRGRRIRQTAVLYLAAEGGAGVKNRFAALKQEHGVLDVPMALRRAGLDLLHDKADLQEVVDLADEVRAKAPSLPLVIVIDTLSRIMAGGDENNAADMTALIRNVDTIRERTGAHIMLVHHTGKDTARGARGHSSLRAATDTEIEVSIDDNARAAKVTKQRDNQGGETFPFALKAVTLGTDQDGDDITSCIVEAQNEAEYEAAAKRTKGLGGNQKLLADTFDQMLADSLAKPNPGGTGMPETGRFWCVDKGQFRELAMGKLVAADTKRAFNEALRALIEKRGIFVTGGNLVWRVDRKINK